MAVMVEVYVTFANSIIHSGLAGLKLLTPPPKDAKIRAATEVLRHPRGRMPPIHK